MNEATPSELGFGSKRVTGRDGSIIADQNDIIRILNANLPSSEDMFGAG